MESELKFAYTTIFTTQSYNENNYIGENVLKPRILIGTSGCIGAGINHSPFQLQSTKSWNHLWNELIKQQVR